jgi:hypothetical protein
MVGRQSFRLISTMWLSPLYNVYLGVAVDITNTMCGFVVGRQSCCLISTMPLDHGEEKKSASLTNGCTNQHRESNMAYFAVIFMLMYDRTCYNIPKYVSLADHTIIELLGW